MSIQIIWETYKNIHINKQHQNVIIRDVPQKWHERIINFMIENFFRPYKLHQHLNWEKVPGIEDDYRLYVTHILRDECSIMVINEETNEIFGVALVKWMTKTWRSWTICDLVVPHGTFTEFYNMQRIELLTYAENHPEHEFDALHLFDYFLCEDLKRDSLFVLKFFSAICGVARHMGMPRVTYFARTKEEQEIAEAQDWRELSRVIYALYMVQDRRPFLSLRNVDEMYAMLYECPLLPLAPFYYLLPPMPTDAFDEQQHEKAPRAPSLPIMPSRTSQPTAVTD